ncbi:MAG TPA: TetR family transcriptional regulator [Bacilli bacterium]|nr:TetR family transcriptional regulator [Bacilli bacterium]
MAPKVTEEHKEQRRLEILKAARKVFAEKGYEPMTMQDVIEETGMSRGGVYLYFSNKEDLFMSMLEQKDDEGWDTFRQELEELPTVWAFVDQLLADNEDSFNDFTDSLIPAIIEFFVAGWREEKRMERQGVRYQRIIDAMTHMIELGKERGEFRPLLPSDVLARHISTVLDGIALHSLYLKAERVMMKEQIEAFRLSLKHLLQVQE